MKTIQCDEDKEVRLKITSDYGDIAIIGFGESVLETVRQLTVMPHDESYLIQTRTEMAQLNDKQRRLIIVVTDMTESFARENLLEFLMTLSHQRVCVVMHNTMGASSLVQDIGEHVSILNTSQQEEKNLKMLIQNLYDIVSHKDESLDHLDEDKNYYQLTSDTFFEKGSQCYIYSEINGFSLKDKLQSDALLNQRLGVCRINSSITDN